ncbi:MAG: hypothetical protein M3Z66_05265, partial [Chloroflexota bacterium]|nr:hypothetical protein [Chloroflexota bacterium]
SYYDPFGNLTVGERALVEAARENHKLGRSTEMGRWRATLAGDDRLTIVQRIQLEAYWYEHVLNSR